MTDPFEDLAAQDEPPAPEDAHGVDGVDVADMDGVDADITDITDGIDADITMAIEAIVMVSTSPVAPDRLAQLLERPVTEIELALEALAERYRANGHGIELARVAGGHRIQTRAEVSTYVERFVLHDQRARLSGAALETLAIIAYKQPISRAQVASIRGVDPDGVLRTLVARGYVDEVGRDAGPGQAILYGTTDAFLEKLGLDTLADLPPIAEFIPGADVVEALEQGLSPLPPDDVAPTE